ncbi:antitoxin Xre/MbcA/ParS toxin-binding domain-containing protein [Mangrovicoccus ximenensis]|uniref:antitoxin Xre/MbcA/ParS toxin-binding domain-containing protein n=1 Tax=Mangrovicoccus ximenensis TaxID=1911570 RepID=UPI000D3CE1EF|nr:antitoxin Xre/MbcA/ParS toxin-binding domain-containing protein [Mangrovicoccus ximenensis]
MDFRTLTDDGAFSPDLISEALRTNRAEIAATLGLGRDAFSRKERVLAVKTQTRLREMVEILNRVERQAGSPLAAYAWFRSEPLPGFGGMTADQLVRDGHADFVRAHLDRVMAGGFA